MARAKTRLSARAAATVSKPGMHADGSGLYLHVTDSGARSWIYRWKRDGRCRDMGLGSLGDVGLAEARELATDARRMVRQGGDPIEARKAARAASRLAAARSLTFRQCAEAYIVSHKAGWRNPKHAAQWPSTLATYVNPIFGDLPVQAIDVGLVMKVLRPIWETKTETASRVRGRIESVLDWATASGHRQGENPARWRGHLENLLPKKSKVRRVEHHAALPYVDLGDFMVALRQQDGIAARALEFTILTATRSGAARGAKWSEFDLSARLWTVPAGRMKADREHRVPLSDRTIEILDELQALRYSDLAFPSAKRGRPISNTALTMALRRLGRTDLTIHGFRSTFSDWCSERTNFSAEVREMALAHTVSDKVEAAYRRGDLFQKRRQLMDAWARFCTAPTASQTGATVISIAAAK
jgi:integrase